MDALAQRLYEKHFRVWYGDKAEMPDVITEAIRETWEAVADEARKAIGITKPVRAPRKTAAKTEVAETK